MSTLLKYITFLIVFVFACHIGFCQEIYIKKNRVVDETKQGVPYVNIYFQDRQIGTITDSLGYFSINQEILKKNSNDTVVFSSLGYKVIKKAVKDIKKESVIELTKSTITIPELVVYPPKYTIRNYGFAKSRTSILSLSGNPGDCLFVHIQNKQDFKKGIVESVTFKLKDIKNPDYYKVRLRFFLKKGNGFIVNDHLDKPLIISDFTCKNLTVDLKEFNIPFSKDGVYVGLEWIVEAGKAINMKVDCKPRLKCTRKKDNNSFWIYDLKKNNFFPFPEYVDNEFPDVKGLFRKIVKESVPKIGIMVAEFE